MKIRKVTSLYCSDEKSSAGVELDVMKSVVDAYGKRSLRVLKKH